MDKYWCYQYAHSLQPVEINPQSRLYCVENIFNSSIYTPVGSTRNTYLCPAFKFRFITKGFLCTLRLSIVKMKNLPGWFWYNCQQYDQWNHWIFPLSCLPPSIVRANAFGQHYCHKLQDVGSPSPHVHIHHSDCSTWTKLSYQTFDPNALKRTQLQQYQLCLQCEHLSCQRGGGGPSNNILASHVLWQECKSAVIEAAFRFKPRSFSTRCTCKFEYRLFVGSILYKYALHSEIVAFGKTPQYWANCSRSVPLTREGKRQQWQLATVTAGTVNWRLQLTELPDWRGGGSNGFGEGGNWL